MLGEGKGLRPWVYNAMSRGRFRRLHRLTGPVFLAILLLVPWINVAGAPLFRIELAARRVFLAGAMFTPLDTRFLLVLGLFAGFGVMLATALFGRVWCGYACPQTVFLEEIVRRIEFWIEGDRGARRKLDAGPWDARKIAKKAAKWSSFAAVSVVLGVSIVSFFADPRLLWTGQGTVAAYSVAGIFTAALYFDLAWFREQFCNYICPYARFQGALTDVHSLVIGYDPRRGEPRAGTRGVTAKLAASTGSCVDCNRCVMVCPQGIDIRNGYQLECIACGHCSDACTEVMGRQGHKSLITYTTEAELQGVPKPKRRVRPMVYGGLMTGLAVAGLAMLLARHSFEVRVTRTRGTDFGVTADGRHQNMFDGHVWNNTLRERQFTISVDGIDGAEVIASPNPLTLGPGEHRVMPVLVVVPSGATAARSTPFDFVVESDDGQLTRHTTFLSNETH
jgi:cytochrome c oxidase accessory protein FixG